MWAKLLNIWKWVTTPLCFGRPLHLQGDATKYCELCKYNKKGWETFDSPHVREYNAQLRKDTTAGRRGS